MPFPSRLKQLIPLSARNALRYLLHPSYRLYLRSGPLVEQIRESLWEKTGGSVASGPFRQLRYVESAVGSVWTPKILGTYEKELWPVIDAILAASPAHIIDIGAAEGYYAVGLAMRLPETNVLAFEARTESHPILKNLAELNGVGNRVQVLGFCTPELLREYLYFNQPAVIICDVEGAEAEILAPQNVPGMESASILVELHDFLRPGVSDLLKTRFAKTHHIQLFRARLRGYDDFPTSVDIPRRYQKPCMNEQRAEGMEWFWMTPINS